MGDLIVIGEAQKKRDEALRELWRRYLSARDCAEQTSDINDGIVAGKAWAAWLALFYAA